MGQKRIWLVVTAVLIGAGLLVPRGAAADEFDTTRHNIPLDAILSGGPPKDGIPAIDRPQFVSAEQASFLHDNDRVVGIASKDVAKAYPLRILNWHEIINDRLGDEPLAVTYCPLTGSAVAFDRRVRDKEVSFGVSGRLYQSNVLMYDRETESLWSQLAGAAVTGTRTGTKLRSLPAVVTSWSTWRAEHPKTLVLSTNTGFDRDYARNPYAIYEDSGSLMFLPSHLDRRLPPKTRVLGILVEGKPRAYPLAELRRGSVPLHDKVGEKEVAVAWDRAGAWAHSGKEPIPSLELYWFAWAAFHPKTSLWRYEPPADASSRPLADVEITEVKNYWSGIIMDAFTVDRPFSDKGGLFVIHGEVANRSKQPVHHVRLGFELLDKDGNIVAREEGYNRLAEGLLRLEIPELEGEPAPQVNPIPPGASDTFRMIFIGSETPHFKKPRVSVLAVE